MISELSELVLEDCLYCGGSFTIEGFGEHNIPHLNYFVDTYICNECHEFFEIHLGNDKRVSFFFSCNDIYVRCLMYSFFISKDKRLQYNLLGLVAPNIMIPIFPVDFSDKEKLTNKLKTYIIFS